ncbi:hypothetical protein Leryth_007714 [Lithospermum erythrorhizon]|nr:hypothetical protein Leryth_007714 [Lithospermum erythrorhizon]
MAANKFATMLHKNTNKITMILVYVVLEWVLIGLLLINSLFSYLIIKFAVYVGLKPPCLMCSRIDHILEPENNNNMHRDLLCEAHAKEVCLLNYCSNPQRLTESLDLSSKPSWDVLEYSKKEKGRLISVVGDDDDQVVKGVHFYNENRPDEIEKMVSCVNEVVHTLKEEEIVEENKESVLLKKDQGVEVFHDVEDDHSLEHLSQHLEFFIDCSGHRLVPVELIDSATEEYYNKVDEDYRRRDINQEKYVLIEEKKGNDGDDTEYFANNHEELNFAGFLDSMEMEEDENSLVFCPKECSERDEDNDPTSQLNQSSIHESERNVVVQLLEAAEEEEKQHSDVHPDEGDGHINMNQNETGGDVSIGTEILDLDHVRDEVIQTHDMEEEEEVHTPEDLSTSSVNPEPYDYGSLTAKEQSVEFNSLSIEVNDHAIRTRSLSIELSEIEEDKVPDTPTSVDSLHHLHKELLLLEKMDSGTGDSLDGSVTTDLEGIVSDGGVISSEQLKKVIKTERKALHAIYSELEEERNASAVAANETMAMINRLQDEKAAMQMEALQYQRMMEEQAEYDQETMQLLNELVVKREREKEELEKELDVYRKKVLEYETKEKIRMLRSMNTDSSGRSDFSSPSCSNTEESDKAFIELNQEMKGDGFYNHRHRDCDNENTPVSVVLNLDDSIADFEGERLSILEQLKVLEEKLMTVDDDEYLHHFEDIASPTEHHEESNGNHVSNENDPYDGLVNGHATNAFLTRKNVNGKFHPLKSDITCPLGMNLLPLFDAISDENDDIMLINGNGNGFHDSNNRVDNNSCSLTTFEEGSKRRFALEEELDNLYTRLQALEEDREFLKHCISSLNKGDKGMQLLHEILHHLKDLRNVDLHVRSLSNSSMK